MLLFYSSNNAIQNNILATGRSSHKEEFLVEKACQKANYYGKYFVVIAYRLSKEVNVKLLLSYMCSLLYIVHGLIYIFYAV